MSTRAPTPSRLADPVAREIAVAFGYYRDAFLAVTRRARQSFETRNWAQLRADSALRLGLHRDAVDQAENTTRALLGDRCADRVVWVSAKAVYSSLIAQRQDWDLAETFFNSVTRRLFSTVGVDPLMEYVASDFDGPPSDIEKPIYRRYAKRPVRELVDACLEDIPLTVTWIDREGDAALVAARIEEALSAAPMLEDDAITVRVEGSRVHLAGLVDSPTEINAARDIASSIPGVQEVIVEQLQVITQR